MSSDETRTRAEAAGDAMDAAAEAVVADDRPRPANDEAGGPAEGHAIGGSAEPAVDEAAELRDRLLRTLAEMENLRGRTAREVEDARKYAVTGFARDLLDVADNLRRALASVPAGTGEGASDPAVRNLLVGVEMTERSLLGTFEKHRVRRVEPQRGERFDPALHQAMFEVPTDHHQPGTIAEVMQAGYVLADRLLRPALVGVAKAAPAAGGPVAAGASGGPAAAGAGVAGR